MSSRNLYTPLPPIRAVGDDEIENSEISDDDDNDDKGDLVSVYNRAFNARVDQSDANLPNVYILLKKNLVKISKIQDLSKIKAVKYVTFLSRVCDESRNTKTGDQLGQFLANIGFVPLFQKILKNHLLELLKLHNQTLWINIQMLLYAGWNLSDKSSLFCQKIIAHKLHEDLLNYLGSDGLHPSKMNKEREEIIVQASIGMFHNCVQREPTAVTELRNLNAVHRLQRFRDCSHPIVSLVALMITAYLVTEEENEKINSSSSIFDLFVTLLKCAMKKKSYEGITFSVMEIVEVINKLAVNDSNKKRIVEAKTLPLYVQLMKPNPNWDNKVTAEVVHGLWIIGFKCRFDIIGQPGCMEGLKELSVHGDDLVKKQAEGALWILDDKNLTAPAEIKQEVLSLTNQHVFISYQWDAKDIALKVRNRLKQVGITTWIDEDNMSGSVLDAMAEAVEKAYVVVICLSTKYKESASCRTEAEYTFRLKKPVIPIRVQPGFYPDGWLGILVGSKLVFDVSVSSKFEDSVRHLIKELDNFKKSGSLKANDLADDSSAPTKAPAAVGLHPSHEKTNPVRKWTQEDIQEWMKSNNIEHLKDWFLDFNGSMLMEFAYFRSESPDSFFKYFLKKNLPLKDFLLIGMALKEII